MQWPVAYIVPSTLCAFALLWAAAASKALCARAQFSGTPFPYRYFSPSASCASAPVAADGAVSALATGALARGGFVAGFSAGAGWEPDSCGGAVDAESVGCGCDGEAALEEFAEGGFAEAGAAVDDPASGDAVPDGAVPETGAAAGGGVGV